MLKRIKAYLRAVGVALHGNYCGPGHGRLDRQLNPVDAPVDALDRLCLDNIARFKRPKHYRFVTALPKNNYGKVLKTELRDRLAAEEEKKDAV